MLKNLDRGSALLLRESSVSTANKTSNTFMSTRFAGTARHASQSPSFD
jgi:hypothetical protein